MSVDDCRNTRKGVLTTKDKMKSLLRWAGTFVLCFIVIYLTVFFGGARLFESGDPILMEIGAALILSFFVFIFTEIVTHLKKRVNALEERLKELETKQ